MEKKLYSERNGRPRAYSDTDLVKQVWSEVCFWIFEEGLLDEAFGYREYSWLEEDRRTKDDRFHPGKSGSFESFFTRKLRYTIDFTYNNLDSDMGGLFSLDKHGDEFSDPPTSFLHEIDNLLDFLELIYGTCSLPLRRKNARKHIGFDKEKGQLLFRELVNEDLKLYKIPLELMSNGELTDNKNRALIELSEGSFGIKAGFGIDAKTVQPIKDAVELFMGRNSTLQQKKSALVELAGAHESVKKLVKKQSILKTDEKELSHIANKFAIRHNSVDQNRDYDKSVWYEWMFHVNLAAIIVVVRIVQAQEKS